MFDVEPVSQLLQRRVADLVDRTQTLVDVDENEPIEAALRILRSSDVLALPVYSTAAASQGGGAAGGGDGGGEVNGDERRGRGGGGGEAAVAVHDPARGRIYIGLLSLIDIVSVVMDQLHDVAQNGGDRSAAVAEAMGWPVSAALGASMESRRIWVAWPEATIADALEPLTEGIHRLLVPIKDGDGSGDPTFYLCSQLDVVRFFMKHCDEDSVLMAKVDSTLVELGLVMSEDDRREFGGANTHTSTVVSVETSWKSTRALRFMAANSLHAVAVVDGKGRLVATLSLSDLRRLPVAELFDEDPTVERLLAQAHRVARIDDVPPPVTVPPAATLRDVMRRVLEEKVHRCWVVEEDGGLVDVVTLTNILQAMSWAKSTEED